MSLTTTEISPNTPLLDRLRDQGCSLPTLRTVEWLAEILTKTAQGEEVAFAQADQDSPDFFEISEGGLEVTSQPLLSEADPGKSFKKPDFVRTTGENGSQPCVSETALGQNNRIAVDPCSSEFERLARAGEWREIARQCDEKLLHDSHSFFLRAWWMIAQEQSRQMPLELLAAPAESLVSQLNEAAEQLYSDALKDALLRSLEKIAIDLEKEGKREISLRLLERLRANNDQSLTTLFDEMARREVLELEALPDYKRGQKERERLSSLEDLLEKNSLLPHEEPRSKKKAEPSPVTIPKARERRVSSVLRVGVLSLLCLVGIFWLSLDWSKELFHPESPVTTMAVQHPTSSPLLSPPESRRVSTMELDAVLYDLNALQTNLKASQSDAQQQQVRVSSKKVALDLSGPIEPETFPTGESIAHTTSSSSSANPKVLDEQFVKSFPGGTRDRLDAQRYRVIAPTKVISVPSPRAEFLTELRVGDRILVDSVEGSWLKLRSKNGEIGYILQQDAVIDNSS